LLHVQGGIAVRPGMRNAVQGETTQSVAMMAPGVEVPVVSVSRETLGRNGAPGLGVGRARMVLEIDSPALDQRLSQYAEHIRIDCPVRHAEDAHTASQFTGPGMAVSEERLQALAQRTDLFL